MATHSSIAAWRIPRTEGLGGPQPTGSQSGQSTQTPSPGPKLLGGSSVRAFGQQEPWDLIVGVAGLQLSCKERVWGVNLFPSSLPPSFPISPLPLLTLPTDQTRLETSGLGLCRWASCLGREHSGARQPPGNRASSSE